MTRWEYALRDLDGDQTAALNALGQEGWEAWGLTRRRREDDTVVVQVLVKRRIEEETIVDPMPQPGHRVWRGWEPPRRAYDQPVATTTCDHSVYDRTCPACNAF